MWLFSAQNDQRISVFEDLFQRGRLNSDPFLLEGVCSEESSVTAKRNWQAHCITSSIDGSGVDVVAGFPYFTVRYSVISSERS